MAIGEQEARSAYEALTVSAREANLLWVLTQVEEELSVGKVSLKKVSVRDYPAVYDAWARGEEARPGRRPSSAMFVASAEYSAQERLRVLVEALLAAVPAVHEMADASIGTLRHLGEMASLRFVPEAGIKEAFEVETGALDQRRPAVQQLRRLLQELLQEVADGASPDAAF
jgi:hypothetical protein